MAGSRAALWTGIALVLLTSSARNYDQTLIAEKPFLWFFGALLFSFVSATWMYLAVYKTFARRSSSDALGDLKSSEASAWPSFLGLFWMTAPIAWLYAIPVERFMDSVSATHANVTLLGIVSLWRVLLMARVLQVTTRAPFLMALCWVLFAAAVEVLGIVFFGGTFANAIARGMGGMRNSPEEEIMMRTMSMAFTGALLIAPAALIVSLAWRPKDLLQPLPVQSAERMRWAGLGIVAVVWCALAIGPQRELANTVAVERLITASRAREALDFMAARQPGDFAPARALPPKPFEREVFTELPACLGVVQTNDPPWVRALLLSKLDAMVSHMGPRLKPRAAYATSVRTNSAEQIRSGLRRYGPEPDGLLKLLDGLQRFPEGRAWLVNNPVFVDAIWQSANSPVPLRGREFKTEAEQQADGLVLSNRLHAQFHTNANFALTNKLPVPPAPK